MTADETKKAEDGELLGREFVGAFVLLTTLGALYVGWKYLKHKWLIDQGYLPEAMRDYWMVFAVAVVALIVWGARRRSRT